MAVKIIIEVNHAMSVATVVDDGKVVFKSPLRVSLADDVANQPLPDGEYSYHDRKSWENRVKNKVLKALQQTLKSSRYSSGSIELRGLQEKMNES